MPAPAVDARRSGARKRPRAANSASSAAARSAGQRDEQAAGGLRVVRERLERRRDAVGVDVRPGELAVAAVAAGPLARARRLERAGERRQARRVEHEPHAAPRRPSRARARAARSR